METMAGRIASKRVGCIGSFVWSRVSEPTTAHIPHPEVTPFYRSQYVYFHKHEV
jgi:hypothetical protein